MRQTVRRMVSIGGATTVALGAALVLALPASAHTPTVSAVCTADHQAELQVKLENYNADGKNTITVSYQNSGMATPTTLVDQQSFGSSYDNPGQHAKTWDEDGTVVENFTVVVVAHDDQPIDKDGNGPKGWSFTKKLSVGPCKQAPSSSSSTPSTTTPTTVPPSSSTAVVPPATTTTPSAKVAAATAPLANTGVSIGVPLAIAGGLLVIGAGVLVGLRMGARRRRSSN